LSEKLIQKGLTVNGLKIGYYQYYNIGNTTLNQLKNANIIPKKDYKEYEWKKPDVILIDRRNINNIKVLVVVEHKKSGKFKSKKDRINTIQQCNDLCQILDADVWIATDNSKFIWFNPKQSYSGNEYFDTTTSKNRSYSIIKDECKAKMFDIEINIPITGSGGYGIEKQR